VNPASALRILRCGLKRGQANQPDSTFPQLPGIILETFGDNLTTAAHCLSSFNELRKEYRTSPIRQRILVHKLFTGKALVMDERRMRPLR